jgi:hypothetical protein
MLWGARHTAAAAARPAFPLGLAFVRQPKRKEEDDAPGVIALWLTRAAGPACQRHSATRGWWERGRCRLGRSGLKVERGRLRGWRPVWYSKVCELPRAIMWSQFQI